MIADEGESVPRAPNRRGMSRRYTSRHRRCFPTHLLALLSYSSTKSPEGKDELRLKSGFKVGFNGGAAPLLLSSGSKVDKICLEDRGDASACSGFHLLRLVPHVSLPSRRTPDGQTDTPPPHPTPPRLGTERKIHLTISDGRWTLISLSLSAAPPAANG